LRLLFTPNKAAKDDKKQISSSFKRENITLFKKGFKHYINKIFTVNVDITREKTDVKK